MRLSSSRSDSLAAAGRPAVDGLDPPPGSRNHLFTQNTSTWVYDMTVHRWPSQLSAGEAMHLDAVYRRAPLFGERTADVELDRLAPGSEKQRCLDRQQGSVLIGISERRPAPSG